MNRAEFQQLSDVRLREAEALLAAGLWDGAYYLAGYAVECALKACIAKLTQAADFPPRETKDYYTHDLTRLLQTAKLDATFKAATDTRINPTADPELGRNWDTVSKEWSEKVRYERKGETNARELITAITEPNHEVLQWLRMYW